MKSLHELAEQWARSRSAKPSHPSPFAKRERNAEIVWMRELGVPVSHIARIHGITDIRVRTIIKNAGR